MCAVTDPDPSRIVQIGDCRYCLRRDGRATSASKLYAAEPLVRFPDGQVAHVACEIDARRRGVSGIAA